MFKVMATIKSFEKLRSWQKAGEVVSSENLKP